MLESRDGTRFAAFAALPDEPSGAGVVILPDVRGLYRFYEELALRFAERGYAAVAIDYFGRTAGVEKRDDDFEYMPHVEQTTPEGMQADVAQPSRGCASRRQSIFTVGFCMGGRHSWLAAAGGHGLRGAVGFYGRPGAGATARPARHRSPTGWMRRSSPSRREPTRTSRPRTTPRSRKRSTAAGVEHELITYEGAPHSFFDRKQEEFAEASADAWQRTRLIELHETAHRS